MMDAVNNVIVQISDVVWNYLLLFLLVGTGIFFTIRTRFVQVRRFKKAWLRVFGGFSLRGKKAGKKWHELFPGSGDGDRSPGGNRKYRRLCDRTGIRRSRSDLLDVDRSILRNGDDLRRSCSRPEIQKER